MNFIGSEFEAYIPLYKRLLNSKARSKEGTIGKLRACTKQFALSFIFYYINYGVEVYNNQDFSKDYKLVIVKRLQPIMFPKLNNNFVLNFIIDNC
jgi:hypothetical protein